MTMIKECGPNGQMTNPTTQRRLTALLIGAIYGIANGLLPIIDAIAAQPTRPWHQRASLAARFSAILQQLLALTARIRPATLSRNPSFPTPPTLRPAARPATANPIIPRPPAPARLLSARQLAKRLASLLHQLQQLAAEIGETLPTAIHRHIARARIVAGCNALPTRAHPSWETAG